MVKVTPSGNRPRIRRTIPTVRDRQVAAAAKNENVERHQRNRRLSAAGRKFKSIFNNRFGRFLRLGFRSLLKVLSLIAPKYFVNSWREVRKVIWPTRRETWRLTLAVFVFSVIFGALVASLDKGLDEIFKKVVLK